MQEHDLLLAGDPASIQPAREHTLGGVQANRERYWEKGDLANAPLTIRPRQRLPPASLQPKRPSAEKVLQSFNTWAFKREQPSDPQLMLCTIARAIRFSRPLSFALYWGKGPRCSIAEPDLQCMDFLARLADRVKSAHAPGAMISLIFTDTHARLNGHPPSCIRTYFTHVQNAARRRDFHTCWLGDLIGMPEIAAAMNRNDEAVPEHDTWSRLTASARKWYRGADSPEHGALIYYRMNMVEKRAVNLAFAGSIFVTFNGSELRSLFPEHLPIFYMYSLRRGVGVKPWFLPPEAAPCGSSSCGGAHSAQSD